MLEGAAAAPVEVDKALRLFDALEKTDPQKGVYAYFKMILHASKGREFRGEMKRMLLKPKFDPPEIWIARVFERQNKVSSGHFLLGSRIESLLGSPRYQDGLVLMTQAISQLNQKERKLWEEFGERLLRGTLASLTASGAGSALIPIASAIRNAAVDFENSTPLPKRPEISAYSTAMAAVEAREEAGDGLLALEGCRALPFEVVFARQSAEGQNR